MVTATSTAATNPYGPCITCGVPATGTAGMDSYCDVCGAKHNAEQRVPEVDTVAKIFAVLDACLLAHRTIAPLRAQLGHYTGAARLVTFFEHNCEHYPYAIALWASANQLEIKRGASKYDNGTQIRWLEVLDGAEAIIAMQSAQEPQPREPDWRPADNDERPVAEVTATAIREALRKPHWTDDKTLTDEERTERERMEAGHA